MVVRRRKPGEGKKLCAPGSWIIMKRTKECLKTKNGCELGKIFQVSDHQLWRYGLDPQCDDHQCNPIDWIYQMLCSIRESENLVREESRRLIIQTLMALASVIDYEVVPRAACQPDKDTLEKEIIDDFNEHAILRNMMDKFGADPEEVAVQGLACKREIDETIQKYTDIYEQIQQLQKRF